MNSNRDEVGQNQVKKILPTIPENSTKVENFDQTEKVSLEDELLMLDSWDPMSEDYNSFENTLKLDPDKDPECVVTGRMTDAFTMIGKSRVCEFYLKHGDCADGKYCSRLHIEPAQRDKISNLKKELEMNTGRTRLISSYLSPIEITPNDRALFLVSVTMLVSPSSFYFVAPYEQLNFAGLSADEMNFYIGHVQQNSTIKTKLQKCHEQLACLFDHNYRLDNPKETLCIGQIVACKLEDGRFCRAMVINNRDRDDLECFYKLFLLDIGTEVELPRMSIYEIRASCLSEPPMAIPGRLGLKPAKNALSWSEDALSIFKSFTLNGKYLLCTVKSYSEPDHIFTVDLLSINDRTSITEVLLAKNLAETFVI